VSVEERRRNDVGSGGGAGKGRVSGYFRCPGLRALCPARLVNRRPRVVSPEPSLDVLKKIFFNNYFYFLKLKRVL
jgi:hypothetical protein